MTNLTRMSARPLIAAVLILPAAMLVGMAAYAVASLNLQSIVIALGFPDETDHKAPIDYGAGPGKPRSSVTSQRGAPGTDSGRSGVAAVVGQTIPAGGASASTTGVFGAPVTWPIIPIHTILLPDGRVMNYGTDQNGNQGAQLVYDVWNPSLGTDMSAHLVLSNSTSTDIFCSAQSLMLSGEVLTSGGDLTVNGARNSANNQTTIFSPTTNTLSANTAMTYARWYGTLVGLPNGKLAVFGGRQNVGTLDPATPATTPEIYDPALRTWTSLTGAASSSAFFNWWYPRTFVAPGGKIFLIMNSNGNLFYISTAGSGSITRSSVMIPTTGDLKLPTVSFAPGKALVVRQNQLVYVVDYNNPTPVVSQTDSIDAVRDWASGTVLVDGRVLITGGSAQDNQLVGVDYQAQIWDPQTGHWTAGASATKPRLYHSSAMLLADGTVLTGGGGAPGPLTNLNAEIYYPPYLYASDGTPAARPTLSSTNLSVYDPGDTVIATVGATDVISRLTLIRTGSATHAFDADARFVELSFTQTGQTLTAQLPSDTSVLVPGYYMLFAINSAGVPSVARIFPVTANGTSGGNFALSPTTVAFGTVQVGSSSATQTVTVTNHGGTLPAPGISFSGTGAGQFSQTNSCSNSIPAGGSCSISVLFKPTAAGYTKANLNVTASGVTQTAAVNGTGAEPFTVSPTSVSFGNVAVGTTSAAKPITVTNTGTAALPVTSITLTGNAPSSFSQTNNCGTPVSAGSTCTINVTFTPASKAYLWAKVNVSSPGATHSSTVSGTGQ